MDPDNLKHLNLVVKMPDRIEIEKWKLAMDNGQKRYESGGGHQKSSKQIRNERSEGGRQGANYKPKSRSPSPLFGNGASIKQLVLSSSNASMLAAPGYEQYQKSLLEVPLLPEYGEASSDDLSSEWDSDVPETPRNKVSQSDSCGFLLDIIISRTKWSPVFPQTLARETKHK